MYLGQANITNRCIITGIRYGIGATGGTDKAVAAIYNNQGKVLGYSTLAGTTVGTGDTYQALPLVTPVEILAPGKYWLGWGTNGTPTCRIELNDGSAGTMGDLAVFGGTHAAAFSITSETITDITPPTTVGNFPLIHTY
jgi:hypothetical protein